ncbi:MAG: CYTH domain-containing protein [Thermoanaerobaculia bacterium]
MAGGVESEIKYRLAEIDDYRKLTGPRGLEGAAGSDRQENLYLDTADLRISSGGAMLRVRRSGSGAIVTFKAGAELEAGYFRSTEIEAPIDPPALSSILKHPSSLYRLPLAPAEILRARFGELSLEVVGTLTNDRSRFRAGAYLVEVDRLLFPDGSEEYEVEVETERPEEARAWLEAEFRRLSVRAAPSRQTKLARLLRWLEAHR